MFHHPLHRLPLILSAAAMVICQQGSAAEQDDGLKVLDRYVGVWKTEVTDKVPGAPNGGKGSLQEATSRALGGRFVLGRSISGSDGVKALWLMTYDAKTKSYPFWYFNSHGVLGGEWNGVWDEAAKTWTSKAIDTPPGWTSGGKNHFPDQNTIDGAVWMRKDTGELLFDVESHKSRQPEENRDKMLKAWSQSEQPEKKLSPELKMLERMIGRWDSTATLKTSVSTPQETRTTRTGVGQWVLDHGFVESTIRSSSGAELYTLWTYDFQRKKYCYWAFTSEGQFQKMIGSWDAATSTFSFASEPKNGITLRSTIHWTGTDKHDWKVIGQDEQGKVYYHVEGTTTRSEK